MNTLQVEKELRALKLTVALYLLIFLAKLAIYSVTGVMALLAEALHTLADIFVSGFLLVAALWSRKEPDAGHMFGHGRAQNVAALVAATLFISLTSLKLFEGAIPHLLSPEVANHRNLPLAVGVIVLSMLIAAAPLVGLIRQGQKGAAAKAQMMELVNDELGLAAALVGTLFIAAGRPEADAVATLVVATIIAVNAVGLLRENVSFLMGRSPGQEFLCRVTELARSVPGVVGVHGIRAEQIGPDTVHAGMHIQVRPGLSIEEAEQIAKEVHSRVQEATGCRYCLLHVETAGPDAGEPGPCNCEGEAGRLV